MSARARRRPHRVDARAGYPRVRAVAVAVALGVTAGFTGGCGPAGSSHASDASAGDGGDAPAREGFAARVVRFEPGPGATFGHSRMPDIVLGAPEGAGDMAGSTHVASLGRGGTLCVAFDGAVLDGPGVDLLVFENAFYASGTANLFVELGEVSVSEDGQRFVTFPCARAAPYAGCAGASPVYSNPSNGLDARDPHEAGGDGFDLATVGLARARVVCVRDLETQPPAAPATGFDLDAVSAVYFER